MDKHYKVDTLVSKVRDNNNSNLSSNLPEEKQAEG